MQSLVGAGANVHAKNAKNLTAVGCAATAGQLEAVVELVRQGAAWRNLTDVNVVKAIVRKTLAKGASRRSRNAPCRACLRGCDTPHALRL